MSRIHRTSYLPCKLHLAGWRDARPGATGRKGTPHAIVNAWMHSPPHRQMLMDRRLKQIGIGLVWGSPSNPGARAATYTADLGYKS